MQGEVHEIALDLVCADGRRLPTLVNSVLGRDAGGEPAGHPHHRLRRHRAPRLRTRAAARPPGRRGLRAAGPGPAADRRRPGRRARPRSRSPRPRSGRPSAAFGATAAASGCSTPTATCSSLAASTDPAPLAAEEIPLDSSRPVAEVARRGELRVARLDRARPRQQFPELADIMRAPGRSTVVLLPLTSGLAGGRSARDAGRARRSASPSRASWPTASCASPGCSASQAGQALDRARLYDDARRREARGHLPGRDHPGARRGPPAGAAGARLVDRMVPEIAEWAAVRLRSGRPECSPRRVAPRPTRPGSPHRIAAVTVTGEAQLADDGDPTRTARCCR